jgi:phospholipase C
MIMRHGRRAEAQCSNPQAVTNAAMKATRHYFLAALVAISMASGAAAASDAGADAALLKQAQGHISHVVIIMQENRSFDSYFGTFPNAHGFSPNTCVPFDPAHPAAGCIAPFHNPLDVNAGGPHTENDAGADLNNGVTTAFMNGFVKQQETANRHCFNSPALCAQAALGISHHDVVGFHTDAEIPNYWTYAKNFVLLDNFYEGARSYSQISHIELTSEWSAKCTNKLDAKSCRTAVAIPNANAETSYPWVNLFQLLDLNKVSWKYYIAEGNEPDCEDSAMTCAPKPQSAAAPSIWNPVGYYGYVKSQGNAYLSAHNPSLSQFYQDIKANTLPQVSWIMPDISVSEHPPASITLGMEYVTGLVNTIMSSPYWANTAIFITWDDWGGFYDHVPPPNVDRDHEGEPIAGYGLRVPGLTISAYAKQGFIDDGVMSFDAYATFIEDLFIHSTRLVPAALGNPDRRPDIRDSLRHVRFYNRRIADVGNLVSDFDFNQPPRPPMLLPLDIPTSLLADCGATPASALKCTTPSVKLSWQVIAPQLGTPPFTFHVVRDMPPVPVCVTTAATCTDTPGPGDHVYRAWAVDGKNVASPLSAGTEADEP